MDGAQSFGYVVDEMMGVLTETLHTVIDDLIIQMYDCFTEFERQELSACKTNIVRVKEFFSTLKTKNVTVYERCLIAIKDLQHPKTARILREKWTNAQTRRPVVSTAIRSDVVPTEDLCVRHLDTNTLERLNEKYVTFIEELKRIFNKDKQRYSVPDIITGLCTADKENLTYFSQIQCLHSVQTINDLMFYIGRECKYFDYTILKTFINGSGCMEAKILMENYIKETENELLTDLDLKLEAASGDKTNLKKLEIVCDMKKLNVKELTLIVETLQRCLRLPSASVSVKDVIQCCIILECRIPATVKSYLLQLKIVVKKLKPLSRFKVKSLVIDEEFELKIPLDNDTEELLSWTTCTITSKHIQESAHFGYGERHTSRDITYDIDKYKVDEIVNSEIVHLHRHKDLENDKTARPNRSRTGMEKNSLGKMMHQKPELWELNEIVVPHVMEYWKDVAHKSLNYDAAQVECIGEMYNDDPERCSQELLGKWLSIDSAANPTNWEILLKQLHEVPELTSSIDHIVEQLSNMHV